MITSKRAMGVTHQNIADHLGISRQLVTHALNGTLHSRISEETRHEILKVARELNYQPRNLTTHNIGYLLPSEGVYLEAEHTLSLMMEREARAAGFRLIVMGIRGADELASLSDVLNAKTVDGVICSRWYGDGFRAFLPPQLPWIAVTSQDSVPDDVDLVSTHMRNTARAMAEHLIEKGHTTIGLACSASPIAQHRDFELGVQEAFEAAGLSLRGMRPVKGTTEEVSQQLGQLLVAPDAPTSWISLSPKYATTILFGLYSKGKRVPEDVSLMSYIDSPHFTSLPAPITATSAVGPEVAHYAIARLVRRIKGLDTRVAHEFLPAQIVERQSVAPPPAGATRS